MDSKVAKLASYKQIAGIAVAAIILTVIFVPLQTAQAYTADLTLPNASPGAVPTSAVGSAFKVTITPAPSELISVYTIELILDNGTPDVNRAVFASNGHRVDGSPNLVRGNLDITIPTPTTQGYGYGYGVVSSGTTFSSPYSYAFTYSNAFIAGNTVGYSNAVSGANLVTGIVGDGTAQIIIEGKLNTALMDVGSHTLDILVNTGAGGNGVDKIVTPQLSFTTVGNSAVGTSSVPSGTDVESEATIGTDKVKLKVKNSNGGTLAAEKGKPSDIQTKLGKTLFESTSGDTGTFKSGNKNVQTKSEVFDITYSPTTFTSTTFSVSLTLPKIPSIDCTNARAFHNPGSTTTWDDVTFSCSSTTTEIVLQTIEISSLSPFVIGTYTGTAGTTTTTTTGGASGGSGVVINQTFPAEYFEIRPLQKLQLQDTKFVNNAGNTVFGGKVGQQISIDATFRNYQQNGQAYAIIMQIVDKDGFTTDLSWVTGVVDTAQSASASRSWTIAAEGDYTVRIFVWNGISQSPTPLSEVTNKTFTVTS